MNRSSRLIGALFVVASSTQCLLFTDPPNQAPKVEMISPLEIVLRKPAEFSAVPSDPDEDAATLKLEWFTRDASDCPAKLEDARAAPELPRGQDPRFSRPVEKMAPFCVWVIVTDKHGARGFAGQGFDVMNGKPTAHLRMAMPTVSTTVVPLYSDVFLTGMGSTDREDGDRLTYRWRVRTPANKPEPPPCDLLAGVTGIEVNQVRCWRFDQPGEYEFELWVQDTLMAESDPATLKLTVEPDAPPCIERTEPPFGLTSFVADPNQPLAFRLLDIRDDGDPFPTPAGGAPTGELSWSYRLAGSMDTQRFTSTTMTTLVFPQNRFRTGDVVEVWLDYRDRDPAHDPITTCNTMLTCEMPKGCFQRVSWKVTLL